MKEKCKFGQCYNDSVGQIEFRLPAYDGEAAQDAKMDICANHLLWVKGRKWARLPEADPNPHDLHAV